MNKIRINQLGYAPSLPKRVAVLSQAPAVLYDKDGKEVSRFDEIKTWFDPSSGDNVALLDLGNLPAGEYTLKQDGECRSIKVQAQPYRALSNALVKGLYFQRCGCALEEKYAGPYVHAACHTAPARLYEDESLVEKKVSGGWHDAGDYGRYAAPGELTIGHMLYAFRFFPEAYTDSLNIPESGNGVPDILNECRYELDWLLRVQREDGGVYHKLTKKRFAPFIMPEEDTTQEYLLPVSHCATAGLAACAALSARVYAPYDKAFADELLCAAKKAWAWLLANPNFVGYDNPEDVKTGSYADQNGLDETFWAACELYAATKDPDYLKALTAICPHVDVTELGWREVAGMGALCCLFELKDDLCPDFLKDLQRRFLLGADEALELTKLSGYGTALSPEGYIWGSILPIMNNGIAMIAAWKLTGCKEYLDGALLQLDYLVGLNALDISFVTGYGENPFRFPHHRPSAADGIDDPVPGLVSGGPNKRNPYDRNRERVPHETYPAKYYLDETPCADMNEIAIYWNSPAIFVAACFAALTL